MIAVILIQLVKSAGFLKPDLAHTSLIKFNPRRLKAPKGDNTVH